MSASFTPSKYTCGIRSFPHVSLGQLTTAVIKERTCRVMRSEKMGHEVHPRPQNLKIFVACEEISRFQLTILS